jgi:predicted ATPase with chaperone activity
VPLVDFRELSNQSASGEKSETIREHAMQEMNFSSRAHERILKVARTLADLAGSMEIRRTDVLEAIQYRSLDRKLFS